MQRSDARKMKVLVKGTPASQGKVQGKARIIIPGKSQQLEEGEVLVAYITDASMFVDIIGKAKAIVTDVGGITSHPAIVARELGLPCVVATRTATKIIKTGMEIVVDGSKGVVYEAN
jgi:pyruvate,water dikinase